MGQLDGDRDDAGRRRGPAHRQVIAQLDAARAASYGSLHLGRVLRAELEQNRLVVPRHT